MKVENQRIKDEIIDYFKLKIDNYDLELNQCGSYCFYTYRFSLFDFRIVIAKDDNADIKQIHIELSLSKKYNLNGFVNKVCNNLGFDYNAYKFELKGHDTVSVSTLRPEYLNNCKYSNLRFVVDTKKRIYDIDIMLDEFVI